jgi:hypothetical protein
MKEFIFLFRMDITTKEVQPTREQMKTYMDQWQQWISGIDSDGQLAEGGNHLSRQGRVLKPHDEVIDTPYIAENNSVAGYIIVLAENMDEATKIAMGCPILTGQNTSVEIRETAAPGE